MPTYDYKCKDCSHSFEFHQKMTDDPLTECPNCKGNLKRLIGAGSGIIFQGSGFYCTDYRSNNKPTPKNKKTDSTKTASSKKEPTGQKTKKQKEKVT
ncbi:MAG: FmdB family zinc ribbon protein [Verrucomicrobiota bacterium]|nr:FmdB family zinc ribbon protein [Verrucomicrobiota bacterium]